MQICQWVDEYVALLGLGDGLYCAASLSPLHWVRSKQQASIGQMVSERSLGKAFLRFTAAERQSEWYPAAPVVSYVFDLCVVAGRLIALRTGTAV